jgi:hypothetical protein
LADRSQAGASVVSIAAWLEKERTLVDEHAKLLGIPPRILGSTLQIDPLPVIAASSTPVSAVMVSNLPRMMNPLLDPKARAALEATFPYDPSSEALLLAAMLYERFGERCRAWKRTLDLSTDRESRIARAFLMPARRQYLYGLDGLDQPDLPRANELAQSIVQLIEAERLVVAQFVPVGGVTVCGPIDARGISVRPLAPEQVAALQKTFDFDGDSPTMPEIPMRFSEVRHERVGIHVRQEHPKTQEPPADYRLQRVILALQLLGFDPSGMGDTSRWTEPGPPLYRDGGKVRIRGLSPATDSELTRTMLEEAADISERIPPDVFSGGTTPGSRPLSRFLTAVTERADTDAILDYAIALEAVLLPRISQEVSFRFSLHGALLLEHTPAARKRIQKRFKALYDVRCKLAHGEETGTTSNLSELRKEARNLCSLVLIKGLRHGWPTREFFDELVLGGQQE